MTLRDWLRMFGFLPETPLGMKVQKLMDDARADVAANWRKAHDRQRFLRAMERVRNVGFGGTKMECRNTKIQ